MPLFRRCYLSIALLAGACPTAFAAAPAATKPAATTANCVPGEQNFWRDQGLTVKVSTKLQFHKPLQREKIEARVMGGVAQLSGNVSSAPQMAAAVRLVSQVEGVRCVMNNLRVGPPLPSVSN